MIWWVGGEQGRLAVTKVILSSIIAKKQKVMYKIDQETMGYTQGSVQRIKNANS